MIQPINNINFTVEMLANLKKLLLENNARDTIGVCDYEWQAMDDAIIYLQRGPIDSKHGDNNYFQQQARKVTLEKDFQDLQKVLVMEAVKSITYKVPSISHELPTVELEVIGPVIQVSSENKIISEFIIDDVSIIVKGNRYITVVLDNGNVLSLEKP